MGYGSTNKARALETRDSGFKPWKLLFKLILREFDFSPTKLYTDAYRRISFREAQLNLECIKII